MPLQRSKLASKALPLLLPNLVELTPPTGQGDAAKWKKQLEQDGATIRARANRKALADAMARCAARLQAPWSKVPTTGCQVSKQVSGQIVEDSI